eukprot:CCRYP_019683-RA/>CCRYP_019683-RA protein AED:0.33 eAED:0.33 QI:90/1/1/1/0/0/2/74/49
MVVPYYCLKCYDWPDSVIDHGVPTARTEKGRTIHTVLYYGRLWHTISPP